MTEENASRLGIVTSGSLNKGLEVRLDSRRRLERCFHKSKCKNHYRLHARRRIRGAEGYDSRASLFHFSLRRYIIKRGFIQPWVSSYPMASKSLCLVNRITEHPARLS